MKERIQIDGHWYVLEKSNETEVAPEYMYGKSCMVETDNHLFDAQLDLEDVDKTYNHCSLSIEVTIKNGSRENWVTEYWDNVGFLKGVLSNDPISMKDLNESITNKYDKEAFISLLKHLEEIGWLY